MATTGPPLAVIGKKLILQVISVAFYNSLRTGLGCHTILHTSFRPLSVLPIYCEQGTVTFYLYTTTYLLQHTNWLCSEPSAICTFVGCKANALTTDNSLQDCETYWGLRACKSLTSFRLWI